jgi:hypothetical protein
MARIFSSSLIDAMRQIIIPVTKEGTSATTVADAQM